MKLKEYEDIINKLEVDFQSIQSYIEEKWVDYDEAFQLNDNQKADSIYSEIIDIQMHELDPFISTIEDWKEKLNL